MRLFHASYNLTRHYPDKWITPLTLVSGLIATGVVTFISVLTESYDLVATSTDNITQILEHETPYANTPFLSYLTRTNAEIWTTNYAIPYTIRKVWQQKPNGKIKNLGFLIYLNNPLLDYNVTTITVNVLGAFQQSPLLRARAKVGLLVNPSATCAIEADSTQANDRTYFELLENDATSTPNQYSAYIQLTRNSQATNGSAEEVTGISFFKVDCFTERSWCRNHTIPWLMEGEYVQGHFFDPYPTIWTAVDFFGKSMWFTVMTDRGQDNASIPNMLAYPDLLANLTRNVTNDGLESFLSTNYVCQVPEPKSAAARVFSIFIANIVLFDTLWTIFKFTVDAIVLSQKDSTYQYYEGCLEKYERSVTPQKDSSIEALEISSTSTKWESSDKMLYG
ncbi:hypothetical protein F5Y03DRAFT_402716 [Xylaria venustula]|nr:hypothetical protein F5Y03DRAFT_402716 [Xylaria venustula]